LNVIYDISVLGVGFYLKRARTGIARVIENLALEFDHSPDVNMNYCAFHSLEHYFQTRKYTEQDFIPFDKHFCQSKGLNKIALNFMGNMYHEPEKSPQKMKVWQRMLHKMLKGSAALNPMSESSAFNGIDIFHSTFYPFPAHVQSSKKLKRVITVYDLIPILHPEYFEFNEDALIKEVTGGIAPDDRVLAISQSTKDDLCNYKNIDPSRVVVTPLAASDVFWQCRDSALLREVRVKYHIPDEPYILSLCTLEPRKNISQTIKCFARLIEDENISDLNLVLVGSKGWNFDHIFDEIDNASLRKRIIVTGYLLDEDLAPLYSGAMMFVYPSFYEGFGLPPLEAMQCGVPVITSNTSSLPEVVGNAGIMVSPDDSDALSQAMYEIYSKPSLRQSMAEKSLERSQIFSWKKCAKQTLRAYKLAADG